MTCDRIGSHHTPALPMTLTPRVKESIKTALAMTIALGIALAMDWDRPYWAGFAVAFISLATVGQALYKGAMRLLGTAVALTMSLFIIALFVQDRWLFMVALSVWVGFCTYRYKMALSTYGYFWFLAGFASVVISFDGGTDPVHAFDTAILRAQETGLGVLVYAVVTTLLWPASARPGFEAATRALARAQHRLYSGYRQAMTDRGTKPDDRARDDRGQDDSGQAKPARGTDSASGHDLRAIATEYDQHLAEFSATLQASLTDSYQVGERRQQWRDFQGQSTALREALERWQQSSDELDELDLNGLLPTFGASTTEIEQRFAEIERLLGGDAPQHRPQTIDLSYDRAEVRALSHFHRAAFAAARDGLQRLDRLTREQLDTVRDIQGLDVASAPPSRPADAQPAAATAATGKPGSGPLPDPDAMVAALRVMLGLWLSYLLWIYLRLPSGSALITLAGSMSMGLAVMPRYSPMIIFKPVQQQKVEQALLLL